MFWLVFKAQTSKKKYKKQNWQVSDWGLSIFFVLLLDNNWNAEDADFCGLGRIFYFFLAFIFLEITSRPE
jgi:hypothetical protein